MKCLVCQKELHDQAVFCTGCGAKVPRCPTCGTALTRRTKFCTRDGTEIPQEILALIPETKEPARQYFCVQCGKPVSANQRVCDACSKKKPPRGGKAKKTVVMIILLLLGLVGAGFYAVSNDLIDLPILEDFDVSGIFDKDVSDQEMEEPEQPEEEKEEKPEKPNEEKPDEEKPQKPEVEVPATEAPMEETIVTEPPVEDPLKWLAVGDVFYFGTYEQDNRAGNGAEPIAWIVLEKSDDRLFVITKYALERIQFHTSMGEITWEDSNLRKWLNTTFYGSAFTAEEQSRILSVKVPAHSNPIYDHAPGNDTQDKIYILSTAEVAEYFPTKESRRCYATEYVKNDKDVWLESDGSIWWWLRTRGEFLTDATTVNTDGAIDFKDGSVNATSGTVRPVMWIKIK